MKKITVIGFLVLTVAAANAAERHRSVKPPLSDLTPAGWLTHHAVTSTDAVATLAGSATFIGLGDDTHGTHEFFDVKLKMIEKLVQDDGVQLVAFEGPFPDFSRLNDYVLGGPGDPRTILRHHELGYWMWASDEMLAVLQWMRDYNATRGDRPAVEVAGFDVTDTQGAADMVTSYLDGVDPAAAENARTAYSGCFIVYPPHDCTTRVPAVLNDLDAREAERVAKSSQHAFDAAEQAAHIAAVGFNDTPFNDPYYYAWRDENMAINALRLQKGRRTILWGHQEHLGRTPNIEGSKPMGKWLDEQLGANYFVIGSCTGDGSFNVVMTPPYLQVSVVDFPPVTAQSYELRFASAAIPLMIVPLRGTLPDWLSAPHQLRGGTSGSPYDKTEVLPQKLDAILYVAHTTPASSFW